MTIITVAASKGGVGKTTIAYELAWLLGAPLVDLDWDDGGATRRWGYRHEERVRSSLMAAIRTGKVPTPLDGRGRKPDLLASHPDLAGNQPTADDMATLLIKWASDWKRDYVVVDTHPGATTASYGAMLAANVVLVPTILATNELNALEGMTKEMPDYPLLLIPNKFAGWRQAEFDRLERLSTAAQIPVGPPVAYYRSLETRKRQVALCWEDPTPASARQIVGDLNKVANAVTGYLAA